MSNSKELLGWDILWEKAHVVAETLGMDESTLIRLAEAPRELREAALLMLLVRIERDLEDLPGMERDMP